MDIPVGTFSAQPWQELELCNSQPFYHPKAAQGIYVPFAFAPPEPETFQVSQEWPTENNTYEYFYPDLKALIKG